MEKRFGQVISEIRRSKRITVRKFAEMLNIPVTVLASIENGRSWPSENLLERIETKLDINPPDRQKLEKLLHEDKANNNHVIKVMKDLPEHFTDEEWIDLVKKIIEQRKT